MFTKLIKITGKNIELEIKNASNLILDSECVVFPTETVYGLGANALDEVAVAKIYEIKNRPQDNPLIVHFYNIDQVEKHVKEIPEVARILLEKFSPGPISILLYKNKKIPNIVTAGSDKVCVRIPSHPIAQALLRECNVPIAAPSANKSTRPSPTKGIHAFDDLDGLIPLIIDSDIKPLGIESTIVDCTNDIPFIVRPGSITFEEIQKLIPEVRINDGRNNEVVPGSKYKHYSPNIPVILFENSDKVDKEIAKYFENIKDKKVVIITDQEISNIGKSVQIVLNSAKEYAENIFHIFREYEAKKYDVIIVKGLENKDLGYSVNNRLRKAASNIRT